MNALDKWFDVPAGPDAEAQEAAEIDAKATILDAIKADDDEAADLFDEMASRLDLERVAITRLVYAGDGAALVAMLKPLFDAAANRNAEYRVIR